MKITIEFEDKDSAIEAMNAGKYLSAIEDADNYLRSCLKHGDHTDGVVTTLEHVRSLLRWGE